MATQMNSCRCGASWSGENRAHCTKCHELFSVPSLFDLHRYYNKCRDLTKSKNKKGEIIGMRVDGMIRYAQTHPRADT